MSYEKTSRPMTMRSFVFAFVFTALINLPQSFGNMDSFTDYLNKNEVEALTRGQNEFTKDFYLALTRESKGNVFFSPFSISAALAMVYIGSRKRTESQIQSSMHFPANKSSLAIAFRELMTDFKSEGKEYELQTSNKAYISNRLRVLDEYALALTRDFLSSSEVVDFAKGESVRQRINSDVENETKSKIKDLIPPGALNAETRMVLVNAIYFKGLWVHKFDPQDTKPIPFWVTADQSVNVSMMTVEKDFKMGRNTDLDATFLSLDYKGDRISMVILLPNKKDGLSALEKKLSSVDFNTLDNDGITTKVRVSLPKFKLEETLNLNSVLKSLGISDLFNRNDADLSGISGLNDLYVSDAFHKAFLEVNEEGAEAAAATALVVSVRCLVRTRSFVADRPFFFYFLDKRSKTILFAGRLVKPDTVDGLGYEKPCDGVAQEESPSG